ncbi:Glycosyl transferases group 1 [Rhodoblastus acidophilus]|uniref:Glycosyl transferases group 1 n=1 Tax=Rhodoblastus acidophilus TaxID=1074 RepID=A0A212S8V9_RHOAC|nr:glycosyltransferase family 4 protein [Rhodoblastus acidophilus]SNB81803.1 Glycosyl transferases group 1 [Rhodoblastus acidophilus]
MQASLDVFLPLPLTRCGPSYTCGMLSRDMAGPDLDVRILTPRTRAFSVRPAKVEQSLPPLGRVVPYRWVKKTALDGFESRFVAAVKRRPQERRAAYIWPDASAGAISTLKNEGVLVFREMINCCLAGAKPILDEGYARLGVASRHTITEAMAQAEEKGLHAVDYIFCPNAMVEDLLERQGIPTKKLIPASYGWEPSRLAGSHCLLKPADGPTFVFVGTICVRKGSHLLLDYWASSGVKGRLVLAGAIEPFIAERCAALLARDDVVVLDYVKDIGALYRSADVFAFPTLEEGGPQVTYEACGCALPIITTPMGVGRIVRHRREGLVLDAYDRAGWIAGLRELAEDDAVRAAMAASARARAALFHWDQVAWRRKRQLIERLSGRAFAPDDALIEATP